MSGSGSMWTNIAVCFVGFDGNGTLNITNGGQVSISNLTSIGENGTGAVTVDGVGSIWNVDAGIDIGGVGAGTLTISNGGHVSNFNSTIGSNPGSNGRGERERCLVRVGQTTVFSKLAATAAMEPLTL